jgi:hypothetical protein
VSRTSNGWPVPRLRRRVDGPLVEVLLEPGLLIEVQKAAPASATSSRSNRRRCRSRSAAAGAAASASAPAAASAPQARPASQVAGTSCQAGARAAGRAAGPRASGARRRRRRTAAPCRWVGALGQVQATPHATDRRPDRRCDAPHGYDGANPPQGRPRRRTPARSCAPRAPRGASGPPSRPSRPPCATSAATGSRSTPSATRSGPGPAARSHPPLQRAPRHRADGRPGRVARRPVGGEVVDGRCGGAARST